MCRFRTCTISAGALGVASDTPDVPTRRPVIVHITVHGPIDYLDANDQVVRRVTSTSQLEVYRRWCHENGVPVLDLRE